MYILALSWHGNVHKASSWHISIVITDFSTILFITTVPYIVIVTSCQTINQNCHGIDFGIQTIIMAWYSSFSFTCSSVMNLVLVIETALSTKQWTLPLILSEHLDELPSYILQLFIFLSILLLLDILSTIYMHGPCAISVKKMSICAPRRIKIHFSSIWIFPDWAIRFRNNNFFIF